MDAGFDANNACQQSDGRDQSKHTSFAIVKHLDRKLAITPWLSCSIQIFADSLNSRLLSHLKTADNFA